MMWTLAPDLGSQVLGHECVQSPAADSAKFALRVIKGLNEPPRSLATAACSEHSIFPDQGVAREAKGKWLRLHKGSTDAIAMPMLSLQDVLNPADHQTCYLASSLVGERQVHRSKHVSISSPSRALAGPPFTLW